MSQKFRIRRPDARANARPRKVLIKHAGDSRALMHADFDMRSAVGRAYRESVEELTTHLGGATQVTAVERRLIDNVSRLLILKLLALEEANRAGYFKDGAPTAAHEAYRRAIAEETNLLRALGVPRRAKPVRSLSEVLSGEDEAE